MSARRLWALCLRQLYLYRRSMPRLLEIFYWPTMDLLLWGFVTLYLQRNATGGIPVFVSYFIGALILWDVLFRAEQGISVSFLEDMWARNLINIFVSPVTVPEYLLALMIISALKVAAAFSVTSSLGWIFYSFDIFKLGVSLLPLALNLVAMGWAIGIFTTALILRYGLEAEILAWALAFLFLPFSAVFYPVEVLPHALRAVAMLIPASHAFEGMRAVIKNPGVFPAGQLAMASGLNLAYLLVSAWFFMRVYKKALIRGIIPKIGE
ncbi:MAG: ABC transporter permease [Nitrospiraceae bacterium]|nr:ABC transporter permease [Nitrospiraceae bacterium]